jgi:heterodisulfide reductase subunit A
VLAALPGPTFERIARELKLRERRRLRQHPRGLRFIHGRPAQAKARKIVEGAVARLHHMSDLPRQRTFLNRSVLVVGGGIAGLSAAEELADAGIEVHLVERQPSIGGYMSRLSKTFPTEDCAMCSLAPRLTNAATESRIRIHALSDVTAVTGPPGEFNVTVRHRPRFVDEKCVGCGECAAVCPSRTPTSSTSASATARRSSVPSPTPTEHVLIDRKGWSPEDPARAHLRARLRRLAARGRYEEATGRQRPNLPRHAAASARPVRPGPHASRPSPSPASAVHRRHGAPAERPRRCPCSTTSRSRSSAAAPQAPPPQLARFGYKATVFEALPVAGGMLRVGIPEYRLPGAAGEIDRITALASAQDRRRCARTSPSTRCSPTATGRVPRDRLHQSGTADRWPDQQASWAVEFLRAQALGEQPTTGRRVVVVGGGDGGYDAGRTAFRCGADEVTLACIEDERTAPASSEEIEEGKEERVRVQYSLVPVEILGGAASPPA